MSSRGDGTVSYKSSLVLLFVLSLMLLPLVPLDFRLQARKLGSLHGIALLARLDYIPRRAAAAAGGRLMMLGRLLAAAAADTWAPGGGLRSRLRLRFSLFFRARFSDSLFSRFSLCFLFSLFSLSFLSSESLLPLLPSLSSPLGPSASSSSSLPPPVRLPLPPLARRVRPALARNAIRALSICGPPASGPRATSRSSQSCCSCPSDKLRSFETCTPFRS